VSECERFFLAARINADGDGLHLSILPVEQFDVE